ncbi:MAG: rod shape-determining protein MreC, partial [Gammaproteobacteria bacterium]|nr:rod shape-determining protein MreC [Gammaproteobacteria bacterium]
YVASTMDVRVGDLIMTSGLGLKFPIGYPVGVVTNVTYLAGQRFAQITVTPSAKLNQSRQVLLVWLTQSKFNKEVKKILTKKDDKKSS